jgi:alpha-1,3-rhamnosyl/mannosyltransferase
VLSGQASSDYYIGSAVVTGKTRVKLIFNAQSLRPPMTGIGNYTFHLLEQFVQNPAIAEVHCFNGTQWVSGATQLATTAALRASGGDKSKRFVERTVANVRDAVAQVPGAKPLYDYLMDKRFTQSANLMSGAVYHETNYIFKPFAGPSVTTVHDCSHTLYPDFHAPNVTGWLEKLPASLQRADCIITDSNLVRDELIEYFDVPRDKLRTVYLGADDCYQPRTREQTSSALSAFGLKHGCYVLLTATLEPRKGIDTLLDAWSLLPESLRREFPLVLTGSTGWCNESLKKKLAALVAGGTVQHLGYVPSEMLPMLFSGAAVFAYPSIYEGFGLPVLEAMSSAVPVICRQGTAMAEFADGSCVLCETGDAEELSVQLQTLLGDAEVRRQWAERGLAQARKFSWQRCASETLAVYRELC